jgi:hypothetical protein
LRTIARENQKGARSSDRELQQEKRASKSKSKSKRDRASNSKRLKTIARENQKGARSSDQEQGLARERENT